MFPNAFHAMLPRLGEGPYGRSISRHPDRPWWVWASLGANVSLALPAGPEEGKQKDLRFGWLREADGSFALVRTVGLGGLVFGSPELMNPGDYDKPGIADQEKPLPHPGYRCGQVWGADDGSTALIIHVDKDGRGFCAGGEIEASPTPFPHLVFDPLMPNKAPWSSAAGGGR